YSVPIRDGDLAQIAQPIEFLGVNHYHDDAVSGHPQENLGTAPPDRQYDSPFPGSEFVSFPSRGLPQTVMGWEVHPRGLTNLLVRLGHEYPNLPPLYITENGAAYADVVSE